jgi:serine protease Do
MAKPIMTSLLEHGQVSRGFLGVTIQNLDTELARALGVSENAGVLISDVSPDSPAERAGLRRGDVAVAVDGRDVQSTGEFRNLIAAAGAKSVELQVLRNGQRERIRAELTLAPTDAAPGKPRAEAGRGAGTAGMQLAPLDAVARARLQVPSSIDAGAVVTAVQPGSAASQAGLEPGDVILEVNRTPVSNPQRLAEAWGNADKPLALLIWRAGRTFYAVLKP